MGKSAKNRAISASSIEFLEPRILYSSDIPFIAQIDDADPLSESAKWQASYALISGTPVTENSFYTSDQVTDSTDLTSDVMADDASLSRHEATELVIVDTSHPELRELLTALQEQADNGRRIAIEALDPGSDALESITDLLQRYDELDAVHIFSHASDGEILIADQAIDHYALQNNAALVMQWADALAENGDILLYGCNLSASNDGELFAQTLSTLSEADVASSADITGHVSLGGDWDLEIRHGDVQTDVVTSSQVQDDWVAKLDVTTGLIHRYVLDSDVTDTVGGANGYLTNAPVFVPGPHGNAMDVEPDGASNYMLAQVPGGLAPSFATEDFSITFWYRSTDPGSLSAPVDNWAGDGSGYRFLANTANNISFTISDGTTFQTANGTANVNNGNWHLVAATRQGGELELFTLDTALGGWTSNTYSSPTTLDITSSANLRIGADSPTALEVDGQLDDVRFYNRVLSLAEVQTIANAAFPVNTEETLITNTPVTGLVQNSGLYLQGYLVTTDAESPASGLTYTLDAAPTNGDLYFGTVKLVTDDTFTQQDIDSYNIAYVHRVTGSLADSFDFTVDDGIGTTTSGTFNLGIDPDTAPYDLKLTENEGGLDINQGAGNNWYFEIDRADTLLGGLGDFTLELTFQTDVSTGTNPHLFSYQSPGNDSQLNVSLTSGGDLVVSVAGATGTRVGGAVASLGDGNVHHLSLTRDSVSGTVSIYVDGIHDGNLTLVSGTLATGGTALIGFDHAPDGSDRTSDEMFAGTFHEVRLFDHIRTDDQITNGFFDGALVSNDDLSARWIFENLSISNHAAEQIEGRRLLPQMASGAGFSPGTLALSDITIDEMTQTGSEIGRLQGLDTERQFFSTALNVMHPNLQYDHITDAFHSISTSSQTWSQAETDASNTLVNGVPGHLATIESATQNSQISDLAQSTGSSLVWLGGSDTAVEGEWRWIEYGVDQDLFSDAVGNPVSGAYEAWDTLEPNGFTTENGLILTSANYKWNDLGTPGIHRSAFEFDADVVLDGAAAGSIAAQPLTYTLVAQTVAGAFALDPSTGTVTVADQSKLDFETNPVHSLTVDVTDVSGLSIIRSFDVQLKDVDERAVNIVPGVQSATNASPLVFSSANGNQVSVDDDTNEILSVTLSVSQGTLARAGTASGMVAGTSGGSWMTLHGTVEDINADLDGLTYTPTAGFTGTDILEIQTLNGEIEQLDRWSSIELHQSFNSSNVGDATVGAGATVYGDAAQGINAERDSVLALDGSGDYLDANVFGGSSDVTLSAWVKADSANSAIVSVDGIGEVVVAADGTLLGRYYDGTSWQDLTSTWSMVGTGWRHVSYVLDSATSEHILYVDGVVAARESFSTTPATTSPSGSAYTGRSWNTPGSNDFHGELDDVRVLTEALSLTDIRNLASPIPQPEDKSTVLIGVTSPNTAPYFDSLPNVVGDPVPESVAGATSVTAGDIDGDGDLDIVTTAKNSGEVRWFANDGNGNFTTSSLVGTEVRPEGAQLYDLDGDGDLDIVAANYDSSGVAPGVLIYVNDGSGNFTSQSIGTGAGAYRVAVGDLDNDGDGDIVAAFYNSDEIIWYQNSGTTLWSPNTLANPDGPYSVAILDLNNDGFLDLVSADFQGNRVSYYESDGAVVPAFSATTLTVITAPFVVHQADVDQDGDDDIVYAAWGPDNVSWFENVDGTTSGLINHTIDTGLGTVHNLTSGDPDGDGDIDILVSELNASTVSLYKNDGNETFTRTLIDSSASQPTWGEFADVDADGELDVLIAQQNSSEIMVHANQGGSTYIRATTFEDTAINLNNISVMDDDAGSAIIEGRVSTLNGLSSLRSTTGLTFSQGSGVQDSIVTFTGTLADVSFAVSRITFVPDTNFVGLGEVTITIDDYGNTGSGGALTATESMFIDVLPVNDAPTLANLTLSPVPEDNVPTGATINSLFGSLFSDPDPGAVFTGLAVASNPTTVEGEWAYSHDGINWFWVSSVSTSNALVLKPADYLAFYPALNYNGVPPALSVHALDDTYAGGFTINNSKVYLNVGIRGGTTPISDTAYLVSASVTAVNDSPTITDTTLTAILEDTTNPPGDTIGNLFNPGFVDVDAGSSLAGIGIAADSTPVAQGRWQYSTDGGANWFNTTVTTLSPTSALMLSSSDLLRFLPAADFNGAPPALTVYALDDTYALSSSSGSSRSFGDVSAGGGSTPYSLAPALLETSVTAVNDAPTIAAASLFGVAQDSTNPPGLDVAALFSSTFADVDAGAVFTGIAINGNTASADGVWQYSTDGTSWFAVGSVTNNTALVLKPADLLRFLPAAGFVGTPPPLWMHGLDDTAPYAFTAGATRSEIDVTSAGGSTPISASSVFLATGIYNINDAPIIGNGFLTAVNEDSASPAGASVSSLFTNSFVDPDPAAALQGIAIVSNTLTADGNWQYSTDAGSTWANVGPVSDSAALLVRASDWVRFTPAPDFNGTPAPLSVRAIDDTYAAGLIGVTADVTSNGGTTAISGNTALLETAILSVNDSPIYTGSAGGFVVEDDLNSAGLVIGPATSTLFSDIDVGDTFVGVAVSANTATTQGQWQYSNDGSNWYAAGTVSPVQSLVLATTDRLRFVPATDYNGNPPSLSLHALDSTYAGPFTNGTTLAQIDISSAGGSSPVSSGVVQFGMLVTAVNDAPAISAAILSSIPEDTVAPPGESVANLYGTSFSDVDSADTFAGIAIITNTLSSDGDWQYTLDGTNWVSVGTVSTTTALVLAPSDKLRFVPSASFSGAPSPLEVHALDSTYTGGFTSIGSAATIDTSVNGGTTPISLNSVRLDTQVISDQDAPSIGNANLPAIIEDTANPPGDLISNLFVSSFSDPDPGSFLSGIAVVNNGALSDGNWEYSSDGGATWYAIGAVSDVSAMMLASSDMVRFLPNADFSGMPAALEIRAVDDSYPGMFSIGSGAVSVDVSNNGGSTPFSGSTAFLYTSVTPVNDAPSIASATLTGIAEDSPNPAGATVSTLFGANYSDVDSGAVFSGIAVSENTAVAEGDWQYSLDGISWSSIGPVSGIAALVLTPGDFMRFLPAADYTGSPPALKVHGFDETYSGTFSTPGGPQFIDVTNNGGSTAISDSPVQLFTGVFAINDAPAILPASLAAVNEDDINPPGSTISALYSGGFSDVDTGSFMTGIAVIDNGALSDGNWEYSSDGGASWHSVGLVSEASALMLAASDMVRFLPNADFNGLPTALDVRAIDDTYTGSFSIGSGTVISDVTSNGGSTPFSGSIAPLNTSVVAVNDSPAISAASLTGIAEDSINPSGETISVLFGSTFTDADTNGVFTAIAVSGNTALMEGDWQYSVDGAAWVNIGAVADSSALVLKITDRLRFVPAPDYTGTPPPLEIHALDNTYTGNSSTTSTLEYIDVSVNGGSTSISGSAVQLLTGIYAVNDSPVIQSTTLAAVVEDTVSPPGQSVAVLFGSSFTDSDIGDSFAGVLIVADAALATEGTWQYSVDGTVWTVLPPISGSAGLLLDSTSHLRFVPAPNWSGIPGSLTLHGLDSQYPGTYTTAANQMFAGGQPNGGNSNLSAPATLTTNILPVDDIPVATDDTFSLLEAGVLNADVGLNDSNDDNDSVSIGLVTAPSNASNFLLNPNGTFLYEHDGSNTTTDSFVYEVQDSTGNTDQAVVSLSISAVNDPPQVSLSNQTTGIPENTDTSSTIKVADIVITDDLPGTNNLQLSGVDAASFMIVGTELFLVSGVNLDYESQSRLDVVISVDDPALGAGSDDSVAYSLQITDVFEPPVNNPPSITLSNQVTALAEDSDTTQPLKIADVVISDDSLGTNTLVLSGSDAALFELVGTELYLKAGVTLDTETLSSLAVTVEVDDPSVGQAPDDTVTSVLQISDVAELPVLSLMEPGLLSYIENGDPMPLTYSLEVEEPDVSLLQFATVKITAGFEPSQDLLTVETVAGITAGYDAENGVLTLSGMASANDYRDVLRTVAYFNSSDAPSSDTRVIEFTVNDGSTAPTLTGEPGNSNSVSRSVEVVPVNDEQEVFENAEIVATAGQSSTLGESLLNTTDADDSDESLVYNVLEIPGDITLLVNGLPATSFTQADVALGLVAVQSSAGATGQNSILFEVDDGTGTVSQTSLILNIAPEPEIGAAVAEVEYAEPVTIEAAPIAAYSPEPAAATQQQPAPAENSPVIEPSAELAVATSAAENSPQTLAGKPEALATVLPPDALDSLDIGSILASIEQERMDSYAMPETKEVVEIVDDQMASLLSLNPVFINKSELAKFNWQLENAGFESSVEKMQKSLDRAIEENRETVIVRDTLIGVSISVTAGFLIWLLRGGALLASVFSISPLWKQLDPLPILGSDEKSAPNDHDTADTVESLFEDD